MPRRSKSKEAAQKCGMSATMQALRPYLPCFFDIPFKDALNILGRSHHTLDPIRRAMNLARWPFADIVRGGFCDRSQIVALRAQMMSHASDDMQRCLCLAATRAEECWRSGEPYRRRSPCKREENRRGSECQQPPNSPAPPSPKPPPSPEIFAWDAGEETDDADRAFWDDMRSLFDLREAVTPDPA